MVFIPCLTCAKSFDSIRDLRQHQEATYHYKEPGEHKWSKLQMLQAYFKAFYEEHVLVLRDNQRKSRRTVQKFLQSVDECFCIDHDFRNTKIVPAGSTATQTKVWKADEYDFNLVLDLKHVILEEGKHVFYDLRPSKCNVGYFGENQMWSFTNKGSRIPPGYVAIRSFEGRTITTDWTFSGHVNPRMVQEDLFKEIHKVTGKSSNVSVSKVPHGPAITIRIHTSSEKHAPSKCKDIVDHDIFVDFAVCVKADKHQLGVHKYGWPRLQTKKCLSSMQIERVLDAEIYYVPKKALFWYVSFSDAAKVLLRCIDSADTCRRKCHKILKADFLRWRSEESFPGISTFIFKNHLFWFNEEYDIHYRRLSKFDREEFWKDSNIGLCYVWLLWDLAKKLELGELRNYFNVNENILENKDKSVLDRLSKRIRKRVQELGDIQVE